MRVAIVHDYLREYGGAERVVEAIHELWPEAPLYTSFMDWQALGIHADRFKHWNIRTVETSIPGILRIPGIWILRKFHSPLRFLAPKIWESFDLHGYDVVISSSGWFMCRGVKVFEPTVHICYIHHPPRNLYGYATGSDIQKYAIVRAYSHVVNFFLRHYDFETAQKVDYFVANSKETARRVRKFYRRESTVIYPPVDVGIGDKGKGISKAKHLSRITSHVSPKSYFLSVGRLSWSKRVDLAIDACNTLALPLKVVGAGKEETKLRSIAGSTIEFIGGVTDEALSQLYQGAKALIFTALDEDFGIVPVEAMRHGTPVIALGKGGVLETVIDGKTGFLFHKPETHELIITLKRFIKYSDNTYHRSVMEQACRRQAAKFGKEKFQKAFRSFVEKQYTRIIRSSGASQARSKTV